MANNPYTSQSTPSSFNLSPPPNDGSETTTNIVDWTRDVLGKIGTPLRTFIQNVNAQALAAFAKVVNTDPEEQNTLQGSLAFASSELTIASGAITPTRSHHTVDTEGDASTDDLTDINTSSFPDEGLLILRAANTGRTVVVKNGTGAGKINLFGDEDFSLDDNEKSITLQRRGIEWYEVVTSESARSIKRWSLLTTLDISSGSSVETTEIPSGTTQINLLWDGGSVSGAGIDPQVEIGSTSYASTSYGLTVANGVGVQSEFWDVGTGPSHSGPAPLTNAVLAASVLHGKTELRKEDNNNWSVKSQIIDGPGGLTYWSTGQITLSGEMDRLKLTLESAGNYDAGSVHVWVYS